VAEAGTVWRAPSAGPATPTEGPTGLEAPEPPTSDASRARGRDPQQIALEAEAARRDFHRAAGATDAATSEHQKRSAALQAFFLANAGRGLLPAGETSGTISPQLKSEEP
jgi:type IV secretion system protein TrbL